MHCSDANGNCYLKPGQTLLSFLDPPGLWCITEYAANQGRHFLIPKAETAFTTRCRREMNFSVQSRLLQK